MLGRLLLQTILPKKVDNMNASKSFNVAKSNESGLFKACRTFFDAHVGSQILLRSCNLVSTIQYGVEQTLLQ